MSRKQFLCHFEECPVIAILRGIEPDEVINVGTALYDAGIRIIEVPLNSPEPLKSIEVLSNHFNTSVTVGAGTVLNRTQVEDVNRAGGQVCLSPNMNTATIEQTIALDMTSIPGVATATDIFAAIDAGASTLKVFPAISVGTEFFSQVKAVVPPTTQLLAVGGVELSNVQAFKMAGAAGFGIGSSLYKPGKSIADLAEAAQLFCTVSGS